MAPVIRPVILSGGAGTRLWPLSVPERPKQFLDIVGEPLLTQALHRLDGVSGVAEPIVIAGSDQVDLVGNAVARSRIPSFRLIVEPVGRNTAPAAIAAALSIDPDEIMVVLPADHLMADPLAFKDALAIGVDAASHGALVTFGITPDRAETGYGYIEAGEPTRGALSVASFIEKPDLTLATDLVATGHYWNSGIFVFSARSILEEIEVHQPELLDGVRGSLPDQGAGDGEMRLDASFGHVEAISLDKALMEKTDNAVLVPMNVGWSDVGSWQSLWEAAPKDENGNVLVGDVRVEDVTGSYVWSSNTRVAVIGVSDMVVVEAPEGIVVVPRTKSQQVRGIVVEDDEEHPGR